MSSIFSPPSRPVFLGARLARHAGTLLVLVVVVVVGTEDFVALDVMVVVAGLSFSLSSDGVLLSTGFLPGKEESVLAVTEEVVVVATGVEEEEE
jgi:hypothetical protein